MVMAGQLRAAGRYEAGCGLEPVCTQCRESVRFRAGLHTTFGCSARHPALVAITQLFLICVAGYLPREQTASFGGEIRHGTTSGRQPGIAGDQHFAAAGETAQLACAAQ